MEFMTLISNIFAVSDGRKKQRMQIREFACPIVTHTLTKNNPQICHTSAKIASDGETGKEQSKPFTNFACHDSISTLGSSSFAHRKRLAFWSVAGLNCSFFFVSCFVLVIDEHLLRRRYFKMERKLNF